MNESLYRHGLIGESRIARVNSLVGRLATLAAVVWIAFTQPASADTTGYVAQAGQTPTPPYDTWAKAASNIQDAISVVAAGTVWVSNGIYQTEGTTNWPAGSLQTNRVAITNAITVRSANNDPTTTIIKGAWGPLTNGPGAVRCVYMAAGSSLIGFMVTNGAAQTNHAGALEEMGGGVLCQSIAGVTISNCVFAGNSAGSYGGAVYYGTLYNCTLDNNSALSAGGSQYGALYNCTLTRNREGGGNAGGMSQGTASNCVFIGNAGGFFGGGAFDTPLINCTFISNTAYYGGAAAYNNLYNCLIAGNAGTYGGGTYAANVYNCTVVSNAAPGGEGGGVCNGKLYNSIAYFNSASVNENWSPYGGTNRFTNSCTIPAQGGWAVGNFTNNPLFVDTNAGNYRLRASSPCINTGTNASWTTDYHWDLDGNPRIIGTIVDMGAYEFVPTTVYYVDRATGSDAAAGTNWALALKTLTNALTRATASNQIWVAANSYSPGGAVGDSFIMKPYVSVYGGFTNGGSMADRNWTNNVTVLDGSNNNYHVIKALSITNFVLDGFSIRRGNAAAAFPNDSGGGVFISGGVPKVFNCTFLSNAVSFGTEALGGGMYIESINDPSAVVSNCVFAGNSIPNIGNAGGGAAFISACTGTVFKYCVFRSNVGGGGAGVMTSGGNPILYRCDFAGNNANSRLGGGLMIGWSSLPTVLNCTFVTNQANEGGAIFVYANSTGTFINCSSSSNTATLALGGAMEVDYYSAGNQYSAAFCTNCVFWGDTLPEILVDASGPTATVSYCDVQGGFAGASNLNVDALFANPVSDLHLKSRGGRWTTGGWYSDLTNSPCIDAGDASSFANEPQPNGGHINMGAYGNTEQAEKTAALAVSVTGSGLVLNQVPIQWSSDASATGYQILRSGTNSLATATVIWSGTGNAYTDSAAASGAPYYCWVLATNASGLLSMGFDMRPQILCVRTNGNDAADGLSWANAVRTLTNALTKATAEQVQIWTAGGTYSPGSNATDSFNLKSSVSLYGGFTNGGSAADRDWTMNQTILDGGNTNYHVVRCVSNSAALLDGFTIKGGSAISTNGYDGYGAGLLVNSSTFEFDNCVFTGNVANSATLGYGGGLAVMGRSTGTVRNCTFVANSANGNGTSWVGGGAYLEISGSGPVRFQSCSFRLNAAHDGGGICTECGGTAFADCEFINNTSAWYSAGAGIAYPTDARASITTTLSNCRFAGNTAISWYGGGLGVLYQTVVMINCSFTSNSAQRGGAATAWFGGGPGILLATNCILWGDSGSAGDNEIYPGPSGVITGNYCDVQGGLAGTTNINVDPLFANPPLDLHERSIYGRYTTTGWVVDAQMSPCIDAGDPTMDFSLEPQGNGDRINMGAYGNTPQASKSTAVVGFIFQMQ